MMDFREQLEGGARFSRIRSLKRMALGLQALLVLVMALVILVTSGMSVNPFYLPINETLVPVLGYLLVLSAQNFIFRYLEIKHSKSDSHRYLITKNTTSNAAWVIGLCVFAMVIVVAVVHSGWATETLSPIRSDSVSGTNVLVVEQDPFGFTRATTLEWTIQGGSSLDLEVREVGSPLGILPHVLRGSDSIGLPVEGLRAFEIEYTNSVGGTVVIDSRIVVEPSPALVLWVPLFLVGFIGMNAGWIAVMQKKKAAYKAASIYSAQYAQQAEAGEETFQQYLDRNADEATPAPAARPAIGAQVKPGVFTTDRPCPVCAQPLVWVQKYSRHYCLTCKAYRAATGTTAPAYVSASPVTTPPPPPAPAPAPPLAVTAGSPSTKPPCPTCGKPLLWVEKHTRFYCLDEKKYAPKGFGQSADVVVAASAPSEGSLLVAPVRLAPTPKEPAAPVAPARSFSEDANAAYQLGDYATAIGLFDQAIAQDPKNLNAYLSKAAAQMKVGQRLEALATLDRAIFLDPKNERTLRVRALILEGEKRWNEALDAYDAYLAVKPADVDFLVKKGDALLALGRREEATPQFEKALALAPREQRIRARLDELKFDIAGVLSRALLASAGGNYSQAIALFDQVLVRDPGNLNALMGKAVALRRSGDSEGGHDVIRKVLAIAPKHPAALMTLGRILEDLGRTEDALNAYTEFLDASPQDSEGWERQGDLLGKMGRTTESLFAFQQALRTRPGDLRLLEKVKALEPKVVLPAPPTKPVAAPPKTPPPPPVVVPPAPVREPAPVPAPKPSETPPKERAKPAVDIPAARVWAPPEKPKEPLPSLQTLISPQTPEPAPPPPAPIERKAEPVPSPPKAKEEERTPEELPIEPSKEPEVASEPTRLPVVEEIKPMPEPAVVQEPKITEPPAIPPTKPEPIPEPKTEAPPAPKAAVIVPEPEPEEVLLDREAEVVEEPEAPAPAEPVKEPVEPAKRPKGPVEAPVEAAADVAHEPTDQETEALKSALAQVKGVGPARLKALLKAGYTSVERVRAASEEELSEVKGLSRKVAKAIKDGLDAGKA